MDKRVSYFRENICYARKHFRMTRKEMAQVLGISVSKLRRIEQGDTNVRFHNLMLCRFCDHFNISADCVIRVRLEDEKGCHCGEG